MTTEAGAHVFRCAIRRRIENTESPFRLTMISTFQFLLMYKFGKQRWLIVAAIAWTALIWSIVGTTISYAQTNLESRDRTSSGSLVDEKMETVVLETELFFLRSEASMVLMDQIRNAVDEQVDKIAGIGASRFVPLGDNYIQRKIVSEEVVVEKLINDPMTDRETKRFLGYAKLRFGNEFTDRVHQAYQLNFKARRLQWSGLVGLLVLCWLAAAYGYLKMDNATRHFYSRRLQTIAIISCLIPLIVAIFIAIGWRLF